MLRRFRRLLLRSSEPYQPGHTCSAQDARVLNAAHAARLFAHARRRARAESQQELDAWTAEEEPRLLASEWLRGGAAGGRWREQGVEAEITRGAEAELERQMQTSQTVPTIAQRDEMLRKLKETPTVIEQAKGRTAQEGLRRRTTLATLLDVEDGWRGS